MRFPLNTDSPATIQTDQCVAAIPPTSLASGLFDESPYSNCLSLFSFSITLDRLNDWRRGVVRLIECRRTWRERVGEAGVVGQATSSRCETIRALDSSRNATKQEKSSRPHSASKLPSARVDFGG